MLHPLSNGIVPVFGKQLCSGWTEDQKPIIIKQFGSSRFDFFNDVLSHLSNEKGRTLSNLAPAWVPIMKTSGSSCLILMLVGFHTHVQTALSKVVSKKSNEVRRISVGLRSS